MNESNATISGMADLIVAALRLDAAPAALADTARAVDRLTSQLGIGEDDSAADVEQILRRALREARHA